MLYALTILPSEHRYRALMPVREGEWREPSLAQSKDQFGNPNRTRFRLTARFNDGHVRWRGWFDSREDADAFLDALARHAVLGEPMARSLWELPTPAWRPEVGPGVIYQFDTLAFLTTTSASDQTFNVPGDFTPSDNEVHVISHGANGGNVSSPAGGGQGGGGGGYAHATNIGLTPGGTVSFRLRAGNSGAGDANASWFNGTSLASSSAGIRGASSSAAGATTNAVGDLVYAGGMGSSPGFGGAQGGAGGGAAGPHGVGGPGATVTGFGVSGGTGDNGNTPANTAGTTFDATHGSGGGANAPAATNSAGLNAPLYGAGASGGSGTSGTHLGGAGAQALIVVVYSPASNFPFGFNMALMGL